VTAEYQTFLKVLPTRWRRKPSTIDMEWNYATVTLCIDKQSATFRTAQSTSLTVTFRRRPRLVAGIEWWTVVLLERRPFQSGYLELENGEPYYDTISAFSHRCCGKPTTHCNKSNVSVDPLQEKHRPRRNLRPALPRPANQQCIYCRLWLPYRYCLKGILSYKRRNWHIGSK